MVRKNMEMEAKGKGKKGKDGEGKDGKGKGKDGKGKGKKGKAFDPLDVVPKEIKAM